MDSPIYALIDELRGILGRWEKDTEYIKLNYPTLSTMESGHLLTLQNARELLDQLEEYLTDFGKDLGEMVIELRRQDACPPDKTHT